MLGLVFGLLGITGGLNKLKKELIACAFPLKTYRVNCAFALNMSPIVSKNLGVLDLLES